MFDGVSVPVTGARAPTSVQFSALKKQDSICSPIFFFVDTHMLHQLTPLSLIVWSVLE